MFDYIRALFSGSKRMVSSLEVLSRMLKRYAYQNVLLHCNDWRCFLDEVAAELQVERHSLAREVAAQLRVEFIQELPSIELEALTPRLTLKECRQLGLMPLSNAGRITGLICTDPERVQRLAAEFRTLPIYIGLWLDIEAAITAAEMLEGTKTKAESVDLKERDKLKDSGSKAVDTVMSLLVSEVESFGASEVSVIFGADSIEYEFVTSDSKRASGAINSKVAKGLRERLEQSNVNLKDTTNATKLLSIAKIGPERYVLTWGEKAKESEPKLNAAINNPPTLSIVKSDSVAQVEEPSALPQRSAPSKRVDFSTKQPLVLVLDDNPTFSLVLERFFSRQKMDVKIYTSTDSAIVAFERGEVKPDIIVCDLHLPGKSGLALLDQVRREQFRQVPFIMLTSDDDVESEIKVLSLGADAYVTKNQDPRILSAHVERLLKQRSVQAA